MTTLALFSGRNISWKLCLVGLVPGPDSGADTVLLWRRGRAQGRGAHPNGAGILPQVKGGGRFWEGVDRFIQMFSSDSYTS